MEPTSATKPAQHEPSDSIYELYILVLTIFSLLMVAAYYLLGLTEPTKKALLWFDLPISLIFLADAFRSLRRAPEKRAYLKWGWLDFVGGIPLILPLRLARLRRLAQAWRTLRGRSASQVGEDLDRNRAQSAAFLMALLILIILPTATIAVVGFESSAPEANIQSGGDALWWSFVTMSTVGYGDFYPTTTGGRLAALALMTVGIGIYGVLTSYLAHLFLPDTDDDATSPAESGELVGIQAELDAVNARLDAIQVLLGDLVPPAGGRGAEHDEYPERVAQRESRNRNHVQG